MKRLGFTLMVITAVALVGAVGCGQNRAVDTDRVEQSFQNAPDDDREAVRKAIAAVKAGDYAGALAAVEKVPDSPKLTPAQQESLRDLMIQLQKLAPGATSAPPAAPSAPATGGSRP
jgi:Tfp pilus assembly protein PilF